MQLFWRVSGCRYFNTIAVSHTLWYQGSDIASLVVKNLSVKNLSVIDTPGGWLSNVQPSGGKVSQDKADCAVFITIYDRSIAINTNFSEEVDTLCLLLLKRNQTHTDNVNSTVSIVACTLCALSWCHFSRTAVFYLQLSSNILDPWVVVWHFA